MADRWSKRKPEMARRQCAHCSAEFLTSHAKQQKYCGSACRGMAAQVQAREPVRLCAVCGREFPRCGHIKFCSDECRDARNRSHQRASALRHGRLKGPQQLTCAHCDASFTGRADQLYCSGKCKDAARDKALLSASRNAWREKNIDRVRAHCKEYKARVRAEGRRADRSSEYEARNAKRLSESVRRDGERALSRIAAIGCQRYAHVPVLVAGLIRIVGKIDSKAMAVKERAERPKAARAQSEYTLSLKSRPVAYIAALGRWRAKTLNRKSGLVMIDDGTASAVAVSLMSTKVCLYCACALTNESRTIDHMDPLSKGGAHSASNLCACCSACNNKKGPSGFMQFVAGLSDKHRRRAVAYYEKLNGFVQQSPLSFGMAA